MIRILGVNLLPNKKIYIALTDIYGIGVHKSKNILKYFNINPNLKVLELTDDNFSKIRDFLESQNFEFEGNLKRSLKQNISRLININCYRGKRHLKGLPSRGQRTRTNSKTSRKLFLGNKKV